jgi:hypothetical protein
MRLLTAHANPKLLVPRWDVESPGHPIPQREQLAVILVEVLRKIAVMNLMLGGADEDATRYLPP